VAELARGTLADRPWGRTLGALGSKGLTGQITVAADNKRFAVAFVHGAVAGAVSPLTNDAAVRVAMTAGLVSSTQVADLARRQLASPGRDEIDLICEFARLGPEHGSWLRRRVNAQRAARTFSPEVGDFIVTDDITIPLVQGAELDVRAVIYIGARGNLSDARLDAELSMMGDWFALRQTSLQDLPQFGFSAAEAPVIELLQIGMARADLEQANHGLDARTVRAMLYALASCNAVDAQAMQQQQAYRAPAPAPAPMRAAPPMQARQPTPQPQAPAPQQLQMQPRQPTPPPAGIRPMQPRLQVAPPPPVLNPDVDEAPLDLEEPMEEPMMDLMSESSPYETPAPAPAPMQPQLSGRRASTPSTQAHTLPHPSQLAQQTQGLPSPAQLAAQRAQPRTSTPAPRATLPPQQPRSPVNPRALNLQAAEQQAKRPTGRMPELLDLDPPAVTKPPMRGGPLAAPAPRQPSAAAGGIRPMTRRVIDPKAAATTRALITARIAMLDKGTDHFTLLGVAKTASPKDIETGYLTLAKQLHPDKLKALAIDDMSADAHRLFAQVNTAVAVLRDPGRKADYLAILARGGEKAVRADEARAQEMAMRVLGAEEAFAKGENALRRDNIPGAITELKRAVELNPDEPDYKAMLAWAMFCAAPDKNTAARGTRLVLEKSAQQSPNSPLPRMLLGRVERMLGRDREALAHFQAVLEIDPRHAEATGEVRLLQQRQRR
jgi:hypothetical protein